MKLAEARTPLLPGPEKLWPRDVIRGEIELAQERGTSLDSAVIAEAILIKYADWWLKETLVHYLTISIEAVKRNAMRDDYEVTRQMGLAKEPPRQDLPTL